MSITAIVYSAVIVISFLCVAVVYLLYRDNLRERQIKELKKQKNNLEARADKKDKQIKNLQQKVEELGGKAGEVDERLARVEDWSLENPKLLLVRADVWIEDIRHGSSRASLQEEVLPVLRRVCKITDTPYWLVQVGAKLKKARRLVIARNSQNKDCLLSEIEDITDRFDIDLSKV